MTNCEPWKLLLSTIALAGSGLHFYDKYGHLEEKTKEDLKTTTEKKLKGPCVKSNCQIPVAEENTETAEEVQANLENKCKDVIGDEKERRQKNREAMQKKIDERLEKRGEDAMKRLGYNPYKQSTESTDKK